MNPVVIEKKTKSGTQLQATFLPDKGMNLISFKKDGIEVIDQSTEELFKERYAGLGALIGPHFHRRLDSVIPPTPNEEKFPHIGRVKANGVKEPFSHGIARYAPWTAETSVDQIKAVLSGKDEWNGATLAELEGQDFKMQLTATMEEEGLDLQYSVVSDTDSLVGIHYYYRLPNGKGSVTSHVAPEYLDQGEKKAIPADWSHTPNGALHHPLTSPADYSFHPATDPCRGMIQLETEEFTLETRYSTGNQENCWQLYHPEGASFVCIEPMSAWNPRKPRLSVSQLNIQLQIF